jgi:hypothetical protein
LDCDNKPGKVFFPLDLLTPYAPGKVYVLGHDSDPFRVDGRKVGVLKETDKIGLSGLLESNDGRALEAKISAEVLSDFTNKSLERQLANEEFS